VLGLISLEKKKKELPLLTESQHFNTHATLVLCPSHLAKQWLEEIKKHVPSLNVIKITTMKEHKKLTYQDIIDAGLSFPSFSILTVRLDIVIVSFQFLKNGIYFHLK